MDLEHDSRAFPLLDTDELLALMPGFCKRQSNETCLVFLVTIFG